MQSAQIPTRRLFIRQNEPPYRVWSFTSRGRTRNIKVRGAPGCNDGEMALNGALEGRGILLQTAGHRPLRAGVHAVYPQQLNQLAKVRSLIDFLIERFERIDHLDLDEPGGPQPQVGVAGWESMARGAPPAPSYELAGNHPHPQPLSRR